MASQLAKSEHLGAVRLLPCRDTEGRRLGEVWRATMPGELLPDARLAEILDLTGLDGAMLLYRGDEPIGFIHCAGTRSAGAARGWILGFGLLEEARGKGLGRSLIDGALQYFRKMGCDEIAIGGPGEAYVVPGVDTDLFPSAAPLLRASGFKAGGATVGMCADLCALTSRQVSRTVEVRPPEHSECGTLISMIRTRFSQSWADLVERKSGSDRLLVAIAGGRPVGFAAYDLFAGCPGRFGPMGVIEEARGQGIGGQLLRASLEALRARGHKRAWFLWGPESTSGQVMYRNAGFRIWRRFEFFGRRLNRPHQ